MDALTRRALILPRITQSDANSGKSHLQTIAKTLRTLAEAKSLPHSKSSDPRLQSSVPIMV